MRGFEIHRRGPAVIERRFPSGDADAPAVSGFQPSETPFRHRGHEIVSIQDGKIEKFLSDFNANRVKSEIIRAGATISVAVESGHGIAATAAQFGAKNVRYHGPCYSRSAAFQLSLAIVTTPLCRRNTRCLRC